MRKRDRHWRQPFTFAAGVITGSSYDHPERAQRLGTEPRTDVALVLYDHDDPGFGAWPGSGARVCHRLYWPMLAMPPEPDLLLRYVTELVDAAAAGRHAEVFCFGGHGRTGTALACAATLTGEAPEAAVARVRAEYCPRAVSTPELEAVVSLIGRRARATGRFPQLNGPAEALPADH